MLLKLLCLMYVVVQFYFILFFNFHIILTQFDTILNYIIRNILGIILDYAIK